MVAARRQFMETGYHGTSVDDLSRATGLSKGSLYGAFGDKEALFQRIFEDYCAWSDEGAAALLEGPEDEALDRIRNWLKVPEDRTDRARLPAGKGHGRTGVGERSHRDPVARGVRNAARQLPSTCRAGAAGRAPGSGR